jgi:uncharacterized protein
MFGFDPLGLVLSVVGMGLVFLPQWWVKSTYNTFRERPTQRQMSGAEVARQMLALHNISQVVVEETPGELSDHYDPGARAVRLSPDNYRGSSIAAATIAAHEVGHAIQHNQGYVPVVIRSQLAPVFGVGAQVGPLLLMASLFLGVGMGLSPDLAWMLGMVGVGLFGLSVLFHMVTLPVELDASARALKVLKTNQFLTAEEMPGAQKVLFAAAMTYVSVALYSLMQLAYYIYQLTGMRRSND